MDFGNFEVYVEQMYKKTQGNLGKEQSVWVGNWVGGGRKLTYKRITHKTSVMKTIWYQSKKRQIDQWT